MGLYDGYRLSNSSSVRRYQGSAVPEMVAVSQEMQKRYDTTQDKMDYANQYLNNIVPLPQDQGEWNKVKSQYTDKLATLGKRPDLENAVRETTMLANKLPQDYAPFAQRMQDFAARKEELKKATEKNPTDAGYLTPESAAIQLDKDIHRDRGIQMDPATGKYTGRFVGGDFTKDISVNKKIDEYLDHAKPVINGRKYEHLNGQWIDSDTRKTTVMDPKVIKRIIDEGRANDPEFNSYVRQQADNATYKMDYSKNKLSDFNVSPEISKTVQDRLDKGESLTGIIKSMHQDGVEKNIMAHAYAYGIGKYAENNVDTEYEMRGDPFAVARAAKVELDATPRFLIPGNDTVLEDKDRDLGALNTNIADLQGKVTAMEGDMKTADPAGKARIQASLDATKDILTAKQELLGNTKNAIAQRLSGGKYKTADEYFNKSISNRILAVLPENMQGTLEDGKSISLNKGAIHNAIKNGQVKHVDEVTTDLHGNEVQTGNDKYVVTLPNGRKATITGNNANLVRKASQTAEPFNDMVKDELQNNAQSYAFKPLSMNLSEPEQKGLNDLLKAEPNSVAWTKPGSTERVKDGDLPKGMDIGSMKVIAKNGSFYLNSSGYDVEKNGQKKPTGQTYTAKITPGSNVGKKIATNLIKEAKGIQNLDSDMLLTVGVLSGQYKYTGDIASLQNYEPLHIKDKNGSTFLRAQRIKGTTDSDQTPVFGLVDDKGNVLKDAAGNFYQTNDPSTVDYWIQHALQADMLKK